MVGGGIFHLISLQHQFYSHMSVDEVTSFSSDWKRPSQQTMDAQLFLIHQHQKILKESTVIRTEEMSSCLHVTVFR